MSQTLSSLAKGSTPDDLLEKAMKKIKVEHAWRVGELSFQLKENIKELQNIDAEMAAKAVAAGYDNTLDNVSFFNVSLTDDLYNVANNIHLDVVDFIATTIADTAKNTDKAAAFGLMP
jgi:hypothetical protein